MAIRKEWQKALRQLSGRNGYQEGMAKLAQRPVSGSRMAKGAETVIRKEWLKAQRPVPGTEGMAKGAENGIGKEWLKAQRTVSGRNG